MPRVEISLKNQQVFKELAKGIDELRLRMNLIAETILNEAGYDPSPKWQITPDFTVLENKEE